MIYLTDVCGMGTREVMELTSLTENNLRVSLSRARTKVKQELEKLYTYEAIRKS